MAGVGLMPAAVTVVGIAHWGGTWDLGWFRHLHSRSRYVMTAVPVPDLRICMVTDLHCWFCQHSTWGAPGLIACISTIEAGPRAVPRTVYPVSQYSEWVAGSTTECTPWWVGPTEEYSVAFLPAPPNTGHISETDGFNSNNWGAESSPNGAMTTTEQREGHTQHPVQALFTTTLITCPLMGSTHRGKMWQAPGLRTALTPKTLDSCRPHRNSPT